MAPTMHWAINDLGEIHDCHGVHRLLSCPLFNVGRWHIEILKNQQFWGSTNSPGMEISSLGNEISGQLEGCYTSSVPTVPLIQTLARVPHILYQFSSSIQVNVIFFCNWNFHCWISVSTSTSAIIWSLTCSESALFYF